ncbi:hypothetical protein BU24DRAFT_417503 [Aaosphaeria arxii CBS 175.79]|uniref:Uncharacterized protein n=1 Tax=Aaosphaeria arxii CBS 175.79 TaxID=1450172 RepID=A0A6A5YAR9_9PLEO|nr:uncharacterized protein BU24DRAFT_417503 [Aaosphaeria arxii CBS 175.79]KAF2021870.1 hypothetical protein BU24DRAFT_417503 [Aaosphaeria arxii CBS 175.79]
MFAPIGLAVLSLFPFSISAQSCFFPNGDTVDSDTACNPNSIVSACCFDGQACLSNGLCVSGTEARTLLHLSANNI